MTAGPQSATACPSCGQPVWPDDNFCESCRAELAPALVSADASSAPAAAGRCPSCPAALVSPEGYCESCGHKVPAATDHVELSLGLVAGVTDRGVRHSRNEDAMALATARTASGPVALAVVCDGVSTSSQPDEASRAAAQGAIEVLLTAVRTGGDLAAAFRHAFTAAQQAVLALPDQDRDNAPSATFVAAVASSSDLTVCWLGDSRAYWLDARDPASSRQLTSDDSVAQDLVARGLLTPEQAMASPAGHIVTGWIGADLSEAEPHLATFSPAGPGALLLCSDGLWNYEPAAADLAGRALPGALTDPLDAAARLVQFAIESGGSDNITVVLAPIPPPVSGPGEQGEPPRDRGEN